MRQIRPFFSAMILAYAVVFGAARFANAAIVNNWVPVTGGSWNVPANWSLGTVPTSADAATFTAAINTATNVITLDGNQTTYGVNLITGTGGKAVQIDPGTGGTLTVVSTDQTTDGTSTFQAISNNSGALTINAPIQLGNGSSGSFTATFNASPNVSNAVVLNGNITESTGQAWGVRITGGGGANAAVAFNTAGKNYSGDTIVAANGQLRSLAPEMIPNGPGRGNLVLEGNGIYRMQFAAGGVETINGLNSTSSTSQVQWNQNNGRTLVVGDNNANGSFAGSIVELQNAYGFTKIGSGTQSITTSNGSGVYTVSAGTLLVNGIHSPRLANANGYSVAAGASLGGIGTIAQSGAGVSTGSVTVTGTLAPGTTTAGTDVGTLTINRNLALNPASTLAMQLAGNNTTVGMGANDLVDQTVTVSGVNLTLAGTLDIIEIGAGSFMSASAGNQWRLINYTGNLISNTMAIEASPPTLQPGLMFAISTAMAGQVNLLVVSQVPEPRAYVFGGLVCGMVGSVYACRRWKSSALATARA